LTTLFFLMSLVCTVPLGWAVDKFHSLCVAMAALVLHAAASWWAMVFINDRATFGVAWVMVGFLSGMWFTATASLAAALLPKLKYGRYASALGIVMAASTMAAGLCMGAVLDWTGGAYLLTYTVAFVLDVAGLVATVVVFRKFMRLGGPKHYVAPE
jgi:MFS family permease